MERDRGLGDELDQDRVTTPTSRTGESKSRFDQSVLYREDPQVSISYYIDRLGFRLDFQDPDQDPYYGRVSRDGIGIMLKAILSNILPRPNRT